MWEATGHTGGQIQNEMGVGRSASPLRCALVPPFMGGRARHFDQELALGNFQVLVPERGGSVSLVAPPPRYD